MTNNTEQLRNKYLQMARESKKIGSKLPKALVDDLEFFEQVIKLEPTLYTRASDRIKRNYDIALAATTKLDFMDISKEVGHEFLFANDGKFVLDAIAKENEDHYQFWADAGPYYSGRRGALLVSTPAGLFASFTFTLQVLQLCPDTRYFTHHPAMSNQFLALIAMRLGIAYAYSRHEEFCQNYNVTMKAVEQHGNLLEHASDDLKANKLVVLKAVESNGMALQFASPELRDDFEVVQTATKSYFSSGWSATPMKFASLRIRSDKQLIAQLCQDGIPALMHATDNLRKDVEFIHELVQSDPSFFYGAHPSIKKMAGDMEPVKFINSLLLKKKLESELPELEEEEETTTIKI